MEIATGIKAAKEAGYIAIETDFFANTTLQRHGILLTPGEHVLSVEAFFQFVKDGCKQPAKYEMGQAFRGVLNKDINVKLAELIEAQKPFVEPVSADAANRRSWSANELEQYAQRKKEIEHLQAERIRIERWFDSLDSK